MNQFRVPLVEGIYSYIAKNPLRFHMPAHKGSVDPSFLRVFGRKIFDIDLTELPGLDYLGEPSGLIREAEALAAEAFGADHTFFSVNGSSLGIVALMMSCCHPGDKVVLPRNVHRSVITGLVLSGAVPLFVEPDVDDGLGLIVGSSVESYLALFESTPGLKMALIIHPTYEGFVSDISSVVQLAHAKGIVVISDEAHGGHFGFHEELPPTALESGVDATVQGLHKTCGSLTQTAMIHVRGQRIDVDRLRSALRLLQSTSPSYPLMASLDLIRRTLVFEGCKRLGRAIELSNAARVAIRSLGIYCPGNDRLPGRGVIGVDPMKILTNGRSIGLPASVIVKTLRTEYGIEPECYDDWNILFIVSMADSGETVESLCRGFRAALETPDREFVPDSTAGCGGIADTILRIESRLGNFRLTPREAYVSDRIMVDVDEAVGRILAEPICVYPPGIVLVVPGQLLDENAVESLLRLHGNGAKLTGLACAEPLRIWVVKNE